MNKQLAESLVEDAKGINDSVSQVMNMCIELTEKCDELKRQRDEALGKMPLYEKAKAEADEVESKDLKPALILALCQRDIALRSVEKIHAIRGMCDSWAEGVEDCPQRFEIIKLINDVILKPKKVV